MYMRISKNYYYERPYTVKGSIKYTGLKVNLKVYGKASQIGTWKAEDA